MPCDHLRLASKIVPLHEVRHDAFFVLAAGCIMSRRQLFAVGVNPVMKFHCLLPVRDEADMMAQCLRHALLGGRDIRVRHR